MAENRNFLCPEKDCIRLLSYFIHRIEQAMSSSSAQQLANFTLLHYDKEDLPIGETRGLVALIPLW